MDSRILTAMLLATAVAGCNLITGVNDLVFDGGTDGDTDTDTGTDTDTDTGTGENLNCTPGCWAAHEITSLPFSHTADTTGAFDCFDEYNCNTWSETGRERYYKFVPEEDVSVSVSLSNTDDNLDVFIVRELADACSAQSCVAAGDDQITDRCLTGGVTYYIIVDGFSGAESEFTIDVDQSGECVYECDILASLDFSGTFPPTGWTVVDGGSSGADGYTWEQTDTMLSFSPPTTAMEGDFAMVDADGAGSTTFMQESLISPWFDVNTCASVAFFFDHYFYVYVTGGTSEEAIVGLQVDSNSNPWITLGNWTDSLSDRRYQCYDIVEDIVGATRFRVRFYYTNTSNWGYFWYVDSVGIVGDGAC